MRRSRWRHRWLRRLGLWWLGAWALGCLALVAGAEAQGPLLVVDRVDDGPTIWRLTTVPDVLSEVAVREHLGSGLTTTFIFRLSTRDGRGEKVSGGAQVQIRYELWDEVFEVAVVGLDGRLERARLDSFEALVDWWRDLRPVVLDGQRTQLGGTAVVRVLLEVVPFSRSEQRDAQRWFSDSLEKQGRSSAEQVAESVDDQPEQLSRAINLLLATSIQRRALATFQWNLSRPRDAKP